MITLAPTVQIQMVQLLSPQGFDLVLSEKEHSAMLESRFVTQEVTGATGATGAKMVT